MRVISSGHRLTCGQCSSVLEYEPIDVHVQKQDMGSPGYDTVDYDDRYQCYVICPVCFLHIPVRNDQQKINQYIESQQYWDHDL